MKINKKKAKAFVKKIRSESACFVKRVLGETSLQPFQEEKIFKAFDMYDRIAIKATHAVGKTWSMARIALQFLFCYKNSIVITTAPTSRQVSKLLWGEIGAAYKKSKYPLGGRFLETNEIKISDKHYAIGFSPKKEAASTEKGQKGSQFQGFHADYILIIFDEATGVQPDIWKMVEGLLTSGKIVKFVCIGNPTTRACEFFKTFSSVEWHNVTISCFDSPNLIANGITSLEDVKREVRKVKTLNKDERINYFKKYVNPVSHLLSAKWVISKAIDWGITHPLFQTKALAEFPDEDDNVLIQLSQVERAINRDILDVPIDEVRLIGVDVARYGEDNTVIIEMVGYEQTRHIERNKQSLVDTTQDVQNVIESGIHNYNHTHVMVDATGVGSGVFDNLEKIYRRRRDVTIHEIHNAQAIPIDEKNKTEDNKYKKRYRNLKAKAFDLLASDIDKMKLLNNERYTIELPMIKFQYDNQGKMVIESKDDFKERTGLGSPDTADALMLTNYGRYLKPNIGKFGDTKKDDVKKRPERMRKAVSKQRKRVKVHNY